MKNLKAFIESNKNHTHKLEKIIEPISKYFGIDIFWHNTIHKNGLYTSISNFHEPLKNFYEKGWFERAGQLVSPSILRDGHFFLDVSGNFNNFREQTQTFHPFYHPMFVQRKKSNEIIHQFGFASKAFSHKLPSIYLNSFSLIEEFIHYYLKCFEEFKPEVQKNRVNLISLKGIEGFYGVNSESEDHIVQRNCSFLKDIGANTYLINAGNKLSKRQKQVLLGCIEGQTAGQTAKGLGLSLRTVEHYLDAVKDKLGAFNKKDLIKNGHILKISGVLSP